MTEERTTSTTTFKTSKHVVSLSRTETRKEIGAGLDGEPEVIIELSLVGLPTHIIESPQIAYELGAALQAAAIKGGYKVAR